MNVAVVEPTSSHDTAHCAIENERDGSGRQSEWIDPEGDDWYSAIYRDLTQEAEPVRATPAVPEPEPWFG